MLRRWYPTKSHCHLNSCFFFFFLSQDNISRCVVKTFHSQSSRKRDKDYTSEPMNAPETLNANKYSHETNQSTDQDVSKPALLTRRMGCNVSSSTGARLA